MSSVGESAVLKILGLIPARGGSKSIPRKNIKPLAGRPLIAYSIQAALESRLINRVVVSTDDSEIGEVAKQYGAEVPFLRPKELALDDVTDLPVFRHCLDWLKALENYVPDVVVHLRPTAPLRTSRHIDEAIEFLLKSPDADSVRSVCHAGSHPLKVWKIHAGWLVPFVPQDVHGIPEAYNEPRQKLPEAFLQNGAVDVIRVEVLTHSHSMSGRRIKPYLMDEIDSVNIDSPIDWVLAEVMMVSRSRNAKELASDGGSK